MIRIAKDGEVPVGIDSNTSYFFRGDGQIDRWLCYGYSNGRGRGSPGKSDGDGRGIPYSSELNHTGE